MNEERAIVKGHLFGTVQTRNIFVGRVALSEGDTSSDMWVGYVAHMLNNIMSYMASSYTIETLEVQTLLGGKWFTASEVSFPWTGDISGEQIANLVAVVFIGVVSGFHMHGRKFWSGIAETYSNGNSLAAAAVASFATAAAFYVTPYTSTHGGSLIPGVIGKDGNFHSFSAGFVSSLFGSMRRRKPGLGI